MDSDDPSPLNGAPSAVPSFVFASTSPTPSSHDEERRQSLLRRLNEISLQKQRLERRQQRTSAKEPTVGNGNPNGLDRDAVSLETHGAARDDMSVDYPSYADNEARGATINGGRMKHPPPSKRRRGEASDEAIVTIGSPSGQSEPEFRNGKHSSSRVRPPSYGTSMPPPLTIDLDAVPDRSSVSNLEAFTGNRSGSKSNRRASSPQPSPPLSARGSARVRTPSVLLSSQPGEKSQSAQPSAPKNRQVAYCLRLVKEMIRLKDGHAFSRPINQLWSVEQLPGYFDMIKHPMDLGTLRERLENGFYMKVPGKEEVEEVVFDVDAFKSDTSLVFSNACTYNRPGDVYFSAATRLREKFESRMSKMPSAEELAQQAAKKTKKRKKGGGGGSGGGSVGGGGDSGVVVVSATKKSEVPKKRKVARNGASEENGQAPKRVVGKKKPPSTTVPKTKAAGVAVEGTPVKKKKPTKSEVPEKKESMKMSIEDMELRLRALKRQRTMLESGVPLSPPPSGASYLAQAQALYHVEMTFQEKVQLSNNVGLLPADKLQKIVALATKNKAGSMEVNNNEEIELDIDSMNNETLRDMEAYVNQILSKGKGKKARALAPSPNADIVQMTLPQVSQEIERLTSTLRKESKGTSKELKTTEGKGGDEGGDGSKPKSFYDSDSSSDSDESGSGSDDSSDESSSGSSGSSAESEGESMRKRRERNLAHQQAMQAANTLQQSPPYSQPSSR